MLSRRESAFTIVEMIIGMVLLAVALALAMPSVVNILQVGSRNAAGSATASQASGALALLESDLRSIRGPDRATGNDIDTAYVIDSLNRYHTSVPQGPAYGEYVSHDILYAGPTMLEFWADVMDAGPQQNVPDGQPELVRWYLIEAREAAQCLDNARWCVVREVRYGDAGGRVLSEIVSYGQGTYPRDASCGGAGAAAVPTLFCYRIRRPQTDAYSWSGNPRWTSRCVDQWSFDVPRAAPTAPRRPTRGGAHWVQRVHQYDGRLMTAQHEQSGLYAGMRFHPLDRIVGIGVSMPTAARIGSGDGVAMSSTQVEIRARRGSEYQTAIMCGAR